MNCENREIIIKKASDILNIHKERLVIEEIFSAKDNIEKKTKNPEEYYFIYDKNKMDISQINLTDKTIVSRLAADNANEIVIIKDVIHTNKETIIQYTETNNFFEKNKGDFIEVLNDEYIFSSCLTQDIIDFFENTLINDKKNIVIEKWGDCKNVNCQFLSSDYLKDKRPDLYNRINTSYFKITSQMQCDEYSKFSNNAYYDKTFQIRKIYGPTRNHTDGIYNNNESKRKIRHSSCIICLNDDYIGGEFIFEKQNFKYKMSKNDIIIFPPYYTHPHLTLPLENRTYRYTINTWFLSP